MPRRAALAVSMVLTILILAVAPVRAQIGGLVRRAAKGAITDPKANSESAAPNIKPEDQLTASGLDAFSKGLDAEEAFRQNAARQTPAVKTPEAYHQCLSGLPQWPEFQKLQTGYMDEVTKANGKTDDITRAAQNYSDKLKALTVSKCGADPSDAGRNAYQVQADAVEAGAKAAGMTPARYAMIKERVVPYCNLPASKRDSGVVRAESYGYLASESEVLAPRCGALMPKIKQGT